MQKYKAYASRSNECAYLSPVGGGQSIYSQPDVYLASDVDAELTQTKSYASNLERFHVDTGNHFGPVYDADVVDAEIARLKAEISLATEMRDSAIMQSASCANERDLLKAALRWCLENGALLMNGVLYTEMSDDSPKADIAAVIAEAVKP